MMLVVLQRMKLNEYDRLEEEGHVTDPDLYDGGVMWFVMNHLPNTRLSRRVVSVE